MADIYEYAVTIEGHSVVAQIGTWGQQSKLYIDGDLCDIYNGDLYASDWFTILRGSIIRSDGHKAPVEFQIKSGFFSVYDRILFARKQIKSWKNNRR